MPLNNADPAVVAKLQQQQLLQTFARDNAPGTDKALVAKAELEAERHGQRVVDKPAKKDVLVGYTMLDDIAVSLGHGSGVIRLRAGQRIDDLSLAAQVKAAGGVMKAIVV